MALNIINASGQNGGNFIDVIYNEFLVCRLCSKIYRQPKTLACQHTFCTDCIESHYEMDEQDRPYRFLMSYTRDISCPVCRLRTPLPTGGVRRLPDNFLVANLADVVSRRLPVAGGAGGAGAVCEICRGGGGNRRQSVDAGAGQGRPAVIKCLDCIKMLCAGCAEMHQRTKVTSSHSLFPVGVERDVECKTHQNETLRFYCEPCESCICVLCAFHDHKDHDVTSLLDGLQRHRGTFDTLLDRCRSHIDKLAEQLTLIDVCETTMRQAEERIRDAAIESIAAVRCREKDLVEGLRDAVGEQTLLFLADKDNIKERLKDLEGVHNLTDAMLKGTSIELLMVKKEMREKLRSVLEVKVQPTPEPLRHGSMTLLPDGDCFDSIKHSGVFDSRLDTRSTNNKSTSVVDAHAQTEPPVTGNAATATSDHVTEFMTSRQAQTDVRDIAVVVMATVAPPSINEVVLNPVDDNATSDDVNDGNADVISKTTTAAVRKLFDRSASLADVPPSTPPTPRKIPDFSRPKVAAVLVDRGTEMEVVELTDTGTSPVNVVLFDKETSTEYVIMVHKNVSTENQGTEDKGTSTSNDVTAAYRNLATTRRSVTVSRGTCTQKAMTSERATSPVSALRSPIVLLSPPAPRILGAASPTSPVATHAPPATMVMIAARSVSITTHKTPTSPTVTSVVAGSQPAAQKAVTSSDSQQQVGSAGLQSATLSVVAPPTVTSQTAAIVQPGPIIPQTLTSQTPKPLTSQMTSSGTQQQLVMTSQLKDSGVTSSINPTSPVTSYSKVLTSHAPLTRQLSLTSQLPSAVAMTASLFTQKTLTSKSPLTRRFSLTSPPSTPTTSIQWRPGFTPKSMTSQFPPSKYPSLTSLSAVVNENTESSADHMTSVQKPMTSRGMSVAAPAAPAVIANQNPQLTLATPAQKSMTSTISSLSSTSSLSTQLSLAAQSSAQKQMTTELQRDKQIVMTSPQKSTTPPTTTPTQSVLPTVPKPTMPESPRGSNTSEAPQRSVQPVEASTTTTQNTMTSLPQNARPQAMITSPTVSSGVSPPPNSMTSQMTPPGRPIGPVTSPPGTGLPTIAAVQPAYVTPGQKTMTSPISSFSPTSSLSAAPRGSIAASSVTSTPKPMTQIAMTSQTASVIGTATVTTAQQLVSMTSPPKPSTPDPQKAMTSPPATMVTGLPAQQSASMTSAPRNNMTSPATTVMTLPVGLAQQTATAVTSPPAAMVTAPMMSAPRHMTSPPTAVMGLPVGLAQHTATAVTSPPKLMTPAQYPTQKPTYASAAAAAATPTGAWLAPRPMTSQTTPPQSIPLTPPPVLVRPPVTSSRPMMPMTPYPTKAAVAPSTGINQNQRLSDNKSLQ